MDPRQERGVRVAQLADSIAVGTAHEVAHRGHKSEPACLGFEASDML